LDKDEPAGRGATVGPQGSSAPPGRPRGDTQGDWKPHTRNARGLELAEFGEKPYHRMGPTERKFADRLGRQLERAGALERHDHLHRTDGALRKQRLQSEAAASRGKSPWAAQNISTHVFFSTPEPEPKGDQGSGLQMYIQQPERTTSFERDFIAGDTERTCHWRPPPAGALTGSAKSSAMAKALLCPSGCPALLEDQGPRRGQRSPDHPAEIFRRLRAERQALQRAASLGRTA